MPILAVCKNISSNVVSVVCSQLLPAWREYSAVNAYKRMQISQQVSEAQLQLNRGIVICYCLSNAILTDYIITLVSVRVCVCPPIGCRTITSALLYRFSPNFACRSEMWLFRTLLFLEQTGSSLPILEMCKIQFWQFRDCGGHIFSRIVIKTWIQI